MILSRPNRRTRGISVVPMIDVLFILLIFFMVTSTYLDLNMVPLIETREDQTSVPTDNNTDAQPSGMLLLRLQADGYTSFRGQVYDATDLRYALEQLIAQKQVAELAILPSGRASLQDLLRLTETLSTLPIQSIRVIRLEATQ